MRSMSAFWVDLDAKVITQGPVRSWERIINDVARSSSVLYQIPEHRCAGASAARSISSPRRQQPSLSTFPHSLDPRA